MDEIRERQQRWVMSTLVWKERTAWLALLLLVPTVAYLVWWLFLDSAGQEGMATETVRRMGGRVSVLFVVAYLWIKCRNKGLLVDERDQQITAYAVRAGYMWLALSLVVTASVVGLEPWQEYLRSRSLAWIEAFLMLCLLSSLTIVSVVRVVGYWRDRQ